MLHFREQDHISFANKFSTPCLRDKVNAFGGATREEDFVGARSTDVFCDTPSRFFVSFRCPRAQRVQSAMHIGVLMLVVAPKRVDDGARFLRGRRAIKINQRMTVCALSQDWEILADGAPVYTAGNNLVHTTICSTRRRAPLYSDAHDPVSGRRSF